MSSLSKTSPASWPWIVSLLPTVLTMGWLVSKAQWFWQHSPELQFGWVVLMLCAYLMWEAWEKRPGPRFEWSVSAAVLAGLGCALLFLTQLYQAAYGLTAASMSGLGAGFLLVAGANLHYVFGWPGVRHFLFAVGFILISLPIPSVIYSPIVMGLQSKVATINVEVLNLIGIPAVKTGSLIRLPNCVVGIDEACSGIRSLQSTIMATLFIGYLTLRQNSAKALLLFIGVALAIFGNLARSLFLSVAANAKGSDAVKTFHDAAGWSILVFTAAGVAFVAWCLNKWDNASRNQPNSALALNRLKQPQP